MKTKTMQRALTSFVVLVTILSILFTPGMQATKAAPASPVTFTILHTNDFHGQLEVNSGGSTSNPGIARVAGVINAVKTAKGAGNVLVLDAGDEMQGSLLSNLQKGVPTIAAFNAIPYNAATFGNHEFDWGQPTLLDRVTQAQYPYVSANIVLNDTGNCSTAGWGMPAFVDAPYQIISVGTPNPVKVGIIGVTTTETPVITIASATAGLCFKDPAESILRYYDALKAQSDVIVVLSHLGYADGGYGYGLPIYGDQTLAGKLNTAGKPVNLIIGGHSHTTLSTATVVGTTSVVQAAYNGRRVGQADITVGTDGKVTIVWQALNPLAKTNPPAPTPPDFIYPLDPGLTAVVAQYATDPTYQALINEPIGYTNVPIARNYDGDSLMGAFVNDAIYNDLNTDAVPENDVDIVFNNSGGLRTDISCAGYPCLLTYGMMFSILPFGNATAVGTMTGEQIYELLNQAASLNKGAIQLAGARYSFYNYRQDLDPDPVKTNWKSWSWGAFDACVINKTTSLCDKLDLKKTYKVATNEFLAPAGQDNFYAFKYMKNITYWGDMLVQVNDWVKKTYTQAAPYNGVLDGRITRDGNDASGSIIPLTILHHNDSHGNLAKGTYPSYTQLAYLINQERAYNPTRTLLLSGGDNIQGDAMMYYFKSAGLGYAADGTALPANLQMNPLVKAFNAMGYDAMVLGNHEFNFGSEIFKTLKQATFPLLQANIADDGQYGLTTVGVEPYISKTVGSEGIKVAILGIGNHRVPNYELPSNIPGLTFFDPIVTAQQAVPGLRANNDVVISLNHIGFTEDPKSVEVDKNVDTNFVANVPGVDAVISAHSHTNPATGFGAYKYLPTYVLDPNGVPVIINQAYRYNNTLGEIFIGLRAKSGGTGYEVVSRAGQYLAVDGKNGTEDPAIKAIVDPYVTALKAYNDKPIGQTTEPIDAVKAFTEETSGANLQADAAIFELNKNGIQPDIHISGAMTNKAVALAATPLSPVSLKVSDMFTVMPYENSLVTLSMNGPQLKAVLERGYRNYYYYKYVSGYGGYSYYTTCMLDTNSLGRIYYKDTSPALPDGNNVMGLIIDGKPVDFTDATKYYLVSTVNYLAAGSCNFNDGGKTLWPLDQIVNDTQFYVRDAVIDYITAMGIVSPKVEGRLLFGDTVAPVVTINAPTAQNYLRPNFLTLDFSAVDGADGTTPSFAKPSGVKSIVADIDGTPVTNAQVIDLYTLALGARKLTVTAVDFYGNSTTQTVTFNVIATTQSLKTSLDRFYGEGKISLDVYQGLMDKVMAALRSKKVDTTKNILTAFINQVMAQSGKGITTEVADLLIADAQYVIANLK